jgi:hypothetical protein
MSIILSHALSKRITDQTPIYDSEERFSMTTSTLSQALRSDQKQPPVLGIAFARALLRIRLAPRPKPPRPRRRPRLGMCLVGDTSQASATREAPAQAELRPTCAGAPRVSLPRSAYSASPIVFFWFPRDSPILSKS